MGSFGKKGVIHLLHLSKSALSRSLSFLGGGKPAADRIVCLTGLHCPLQVLLLTGRPVLVTGAKNLVLKGEELQCTQALSLGGEKPVGPDLFWGLEIEIGEIVAFVVMERQQLQACLREGDRAHLGFVPFVHAAGGHRELALASRLIVD
jgi:hypothetical protein